MASKKCVRCIIEYIYELAAEDLDSTKKYILNKHKLSISSASRFTAFQFTFMNFPQGDVDVIKDTTDLLHLKGALSKKNKFGEILQKPIKEKYENSTLKLHVNKVKNVLNLGIKVICSLSTRTLTLTPLIILTFPNNISKTQLK